MKGKLICLVGVSASGKSSFALDNFQENEIFSSDNIRKELFNDEANQSDNGKVFNILHQRIINQLKEGKTAVYDATNLSARRRIGFLKNIKHIDCYKECIVFTTPYKKCIENDKHRDRKVGEEVILKQMRQFSMPIEDEGWDKITCLNPFGLYFTNIYKMLKGNTPHDCEPYHYETIERHCINSALLASDNDENICITEALLFHDIGKLLTKDFHNSKGEETEIAHYYGHEGVSAYLYLTSERMIDIPNSELVVWLINNHMRPYQQGYNKWCQRYSDELNFMLEKVHKYDKLGRVTER